MKITSNIENSNYTQWITGFVESVINQADLKCDEVIIDELDDKRMWLIIDGAEYAIRTWNFEPVTYDLQGRTCGERMVAVMEKRCVVEWRSSGGIMMRS